MQFPDLLTPLSIAAVVILLSLLYYFVKNRDILPGPTGLPYFGLWPLLKDETCHLQLQDFSKQYGDLYSFKYLGKLIISLGSARAIREAHVNKSDCFAGRFTDFSFLTATLPEGLGMSNGESWKVQRKFFVQAFKEFGLSAMRDNIAGPIYDSVSALMKDLTVSKGMPLNIIEVFTERSTGTMRKALFGEDAASNELMKKMTRTFAVVLHSLAGTTLILFGNVARFLFKVNPRYRKAIKYNDILKECLYETVEKMKSQYDENHITCVVESYFKERNEREKRNDPAWKYFTDEALVDSLTQFVGDGILTVAHFMGIFISAIIEHPEEQDKIYAEIAEVVGHNRAITIEDKSNMPYTNAFLHEAVRTSNFLTLFPSLVCTKETTLRGYRIPKGSITLLNIWNAHHDPDTYENPDLFDPSRYIAKPGKTKAELPVQFGIGKRACTGEAYVLMQSFLFFTNIVKNFRVSEPVESKNKSALFLMTGNMELCFHPRTKA